jgi:hypothetical protein
LERIYADVLHDPLPPDLLRRIKQLEGRQQDSEG